MTVSRFGIPKSETRDLAERDRAAYIAGARSLNEPVEWHQSSNKGFFIALGVIVLALALFAFALR